MLWSPNCQLLYPFENQANDYSGNARHGTVFGSGVYATKPNGGRCLYFDGVGDYVATPSFGLSGTVVVFAAWTRCQAFAADQHLIGEATASPTIGFIGCYREGGSAYLYWRYADGTGSRYGDCGVFFSVPFNDVWVHLMVGCDYAGKKLYTFREGKLFKTTTLSGTPVFPSTVRAKYVGSYSPTGYLLTAGYLKDVYIGTLETCPPVAVLTANANRLMLGMNPIW